MKTIRQRLIQHLTEDEANGRDLSKMLGISEKEIYDHLPHLARTVSAQGKTLCTAPARCFGCGYVFKNRKRLSPPSRCPKCKSEHIQAPVYRIS